MGTAPSHRAAGEVNVKRVNQFSSPSSFFVNQPISSATNHENTAFKARPNTSRESGLFPCSELFISTNHCTASAAFCPALSAFSLKPLPFLCLWTDLHEIRNLRFFRRALLNGGVVFEFCLFVCLLSWTQLTKSAAISLFMDRFA